MCGVAGIIGSTAKLDAIFEMTQIQAHRGPDGHGHILISPERVSFAKEKPDYKPDSTNIGALGHLRLSILDTSEDSAQPMCLEDGKSWISYNGEVYNFIELRSELENLGHTFRTSGDTEVVLTSYKEWGTDCFNRFNGMWAIIIWDDSNGRFILSRDRFGVKPLHYAFHEGALYLASEIKGILEVSNIHRALNWDMLFAYLKFNLVNHTNETFFSEINSFPPGHFAIIDPAQPEIVTPQSFWEFEKYVAEDISRQDADTEFERLLCDAVKLRMRSDVPVGSCLSGGLDSSAIVCLAAEGKEGNFHTFTSSFDDKRFDERKWSELVNEQMQTVSHTVIPNQETLLSDLRKLIWHQEEPFTTASIFAQWSIMREACKQKIPVLLDGQGADEVLCGYRKFTVFYLRELFHGRKLAKFFSEIIAILRFGDRTLFKLSDAERYMPSWLQNRSKSSESYLIPEYREVYRKMTCSIAAGHNVRERQKLDVNNFSVPSLLRYEDRNSMAFSIESRVPFLDYRLVNWAVHAPSRIKMTSGQTKAILRRAMRGKVPDEVLDRRDKMGFVTPQKVWMKENLGEDMLKCFSKANLRISKFVDVNNLRRDLEKFRKNDESVADKVLFRFYILEMWMETFDVKP